MKTFEINKSFLSFVFQVSPYFTVETEKSGKLCEVCVFCSNINFDS